MKVEVVLDGETVEFEASKARPGVYRIYQNEGLFTSDFVDAVRRLRRWPRPKEVLTEVNGRPCFVEQGT